VRSDLERVLFDEPAIQKRLDELAVQILNDYRHRELTVIAVLTGSLMFVADLLRRIPLPLKLDWLSVVSYHGKAQKQAVGHQGGCVGWAVKGVQGSFDLSLL
jgi:hypoxanthine phosphoribosyltransferase